MTTNAPARRPAAVVEELEAQIAAAAGSAIVMWRGEPIPLADVPERIARLSLRAARELLYGSWVDATEALNPLRARLLSAWKDAGMVPEPDAVDFAASLRGLGINIETPYYAALRRYLALIGIEQGDASEADLWYVLRGSSWFSWFGDREVARAVAASGRSVDAGSGGHEGWRAAEHLLASDVEAADHTVAAAVGHAYASLVGSRDWLTEELRVDADGAGQFADFAAFVQAWRIRRSMALMTYEQRLFATDDPSLQRAYYAGVVGHHTGVALAEAGYLAAIPSADAAAADLRRMLLGWMLVDALEREHGPRWWRDHAAGGLIGRVAGAASAADAIAQLGYDGWDWRPALRRIRTRLIGEMSGYGGPNITTRAGTRKV